MNRGIAVALILILLVVAFIAYDSPQLIPGGVGENLPRLIWLVMALMLVSGAGYGFWRFRYDRGRALAGIVFWGAALVVITLAYGWFN